MMTVDKKNLSGLMRRELPAKVYRLLKTVGAEGKKSGLPVYLVGGMVRDLLLGVEHDFDIDIVVEGNGVTFAKYLGERLSCKVVSHSRFGTATLFSQEFGRIDLATAREEYYSSPAALPQVSPSGIEYDLNRRDFSINSMAVRLDGKGFGCLYDHFGGQGDLKAGIIRSLYENSFVDDPTRIFRAIRFQGRFAFRLERATGRQIRNTISLIKQGLVPLARIGDELLRLLSEDDPRRALGRLHALGALELVDAALCSGPVSQRMFGRIIKLFASRTVSRCEPADRAAIFFMALARRMKTRQTEKLLASLRYRKTFVRAVLQGRGNELKVIKKLSAGREPRPSALVRLLDGLSLECLFYFMACTTDKQVVRRLTSYLLDLRDVKPACNGGDLNKLGLKPGPLYDRILSELRDGLLDGKLGGKKQEIEYVTERYL